MSHSNLYIGLMSGTSADSIDTALVDLSSTRPQLLATHTVELPENLKIEIHALALPGNNEIHRMNQLDRALGLLFAQAVSELLVQQQKSARDIAAIGSHGQTIRHYPPSNTNRNEYTYSVQVADPNTIAQLTGITTVADFRRRDMILGGQGAPLVPAFHRATFEKNGCPRAIINIGGIANITLLPGDGSTTSLLGYDTGPGNGLMDKWIKTHRHQDYDDSGQWASQGQVIVALLERLMNTAYLAQPAPKSTGPELFNSHWLNNHLNQLPESEAVDVQATLLEFTAQTITQGLRSHSPEPVEVFFCGGGAYNTALIQRIETLLHPSLFASTAQLGIAPEWVEAVAFAWLAKQTLEGKSGNAPTVTGATQASVLGAIYPIN